MACAHRVVCCSDALGRSVVFVDYAVDKCTYRKYAEERSLRKSAMMTVRSDNVDKGVIECYICEE